MGGTNTASSSHLLLLSPNHIRKQANAIITFTPKASSSSSSSSEKKEKIEIRVCTNRTCRKQGSLDVLQVLSGIAPPFVTVNSCGCLGRCGAGPNIVILPDSVFVGHCGTPRKAAEVMAIVCGADDEVSGGDKCLEALALRKRAEDEMGRGDFTQACGLLSQAIELKPFGGLHIIYKERSAARLAMGDIDGAFGDVKEALTIAPHYSEAYICEGDVYMAMDQFDAAEESYSIALDLDPSIRRSKSFKARIAKLQEKLAPANLG
ncbi:tetratricopeptide repeat protein [Perilla frutescens var. hirtella]|nr:tetratricopeptide repeat protein [Perilla frutescens var. hirtella]